MNEHKDFLEKLARCAAACENCLDSCLDEDNLKMMVKCIRLDRDCAKICAITASFVASNSPHAKHLAKECQEICKLCGDECEKMEADHCKECAKACRECEEACKKFIAA